MKLNKRSSSFRQLRHDATARILVDAAEAILVRQGFDRVTMRDIAAQAGCATGTIYLYFKTKQQVLDVITERHSDALLQRLDAVLALPERPLEKLRQITCEVIAYFTRNRGVIQLLRTGDRMELSTLPDALQESVKQRWDEFLAAELELFRAAQKQGELRRDFPPEQIQQVLYLLMMGLRDEVANHAPLPAEEELDRMIWGLFLGGAAGPGKKTRSKPKRRTRAKPS